MASMDELVRVSSGMQRTAQGNNPVSPNNGNPNGVYNNPVPTPAPEIGGARHYPWLAPSESMNVIQQMLSQPLMQAGGGMPQLPPSPIAMPNLPVQPTPVQMPVLPSHGPAMAQPAQPPMMPSNTTVPQMVLPTRIA